MQCKIQWRAFDISTMQSRDLPGSSVGYVKPKCSWKAVGGAELPTAVEQHCWLGGALQRVQVLLGFCQRVCPDFCGTSIVIPAGWPSSSFLSHRISVVDLKQSFLVLYALSS